MEKIVNSFQSFKPKQENSNNDNSSLYSNNIRNKEENNSISNNSFVKNISDEKSKQSSISVSTRIAPKVGGNPPGTEFNVLSKESLKPSNSDLTNAKFITKEFYPISILNTDNLISDPPIRIVIPILGIDSVVEGLGIDILGDSNSWETPKNVVGHIPTTSKPSENGSGWYFGHLESPIRGEGNVFQRLPEIPRLLKEDRSVLIYVQDIKRTYLYEVYKADVLYQDELFIRDSGQRDIILVTCYPRLKYDHRIIITAAMVGVTEIEIHIPENTAPVKVN